MRAALMAGRLSPIASQRLELSGGPGVTLTGNGAISDPRGNRRRSAGSCRARRRFSQ